MEFMIFHIVEKRIFDENYKDGFYTNPTLFTRGFIHSVTVDYIELVAKKYLPQNEPVVILMIDEKSLDVPIRFEESKGTVYPHIYGKIKKEAIIKVLPFLTNDEGEFVLNDEIKESKRY